MKIMTISLILMFLAGNAQAADLPIPGKTSIGCKKCK